MTPETFSPLIADVTDRIRGRALDATLDADLNRDFPAGGPAYVTVFDACRAAIAAGWMCQREGGGIRYGRVIKPNTTLGPFSVDVVEMKDLAGPHHRHPKGEIDLIMPLMPGVTFDGQPAGWLVYGPATSHRPTVAGGSALVLYLLPEGAIEFSKG